MNSLERIWARATGHLLGETDEDKPDVPILTLREARIALVLKTMWIVVHVVTCLFIIANVIRHW
jgi:hypothetical protein